MSHASINQQLLDRLKRIAKKKRRDDPSLTHNQWLDALSSEYGFATFASLSRRVEELEQQALDDVMSAEEAMWKRRLTGSMVWGSAPSGQSELDETIPLPVAADSVPWPNWFSQSNLFRAADGPRRQFDGPLHTIEDRKMHFKGEELQITDQIVLEALIATTGHYPCGRLAEFSTADLDHAMGGPLSEWGIPVQYDAIARTLWRLIHCELTVDEFSFKGPILSYADARQAPERFAIRFNPDFANFYYPFLTWFR